MVCEQDSRVKFLICVLRHSQTDTTVLGLRHLSLDCAGTPVELRLKNYVHGAFGLAHIFYFLTVAYEFG